MIRRPPRSTRVRSSAASDVYKRQLANFESEVRVVHSVNEVVACHRFASSVIELGKSKSGWRAVGCPIGGFGASHLAGVFGSLAPVCVCRPGWSRQSAPSIPLSTLSGSRLFLRCDPRGLDRRSSLGSSEGTRSALSWSTCCTRGSSGTEPQTSRTS